MNQTYVMDLLEHSASILVGRTLLTQTGIFKMFGSILLCLCLWQSIAFGILHAKNPTATVRVLDANDHTPEITMNTLSAASTRKAEIAENASPNTFVAHITVIDKDTGRNGQVHCTLNNQMFVLKNRSDGEYKILTAHPLDREKCDLYKISIQCQDGGKTPKMAVLVLDVIVTDVNDHTPMFDQLTYVAHIMENNCVGAHITHVHASDLDMGQNAEIRYGIGRDKARLFNMNPITGRITVAQSLDHEEMEYIRLRIIAHDKGSPPFSAAATVHVNVENVNDEAPTFEQTVYTFHVFEDESLGAVIGTVSATDLDSPPYNKFSYKLLPRGNITDLFAVQPQTGDIIIQHMLDREAQDEYLLTVVAEDEGPSPLSSMASVIVHVEDINDNPPVFTFPISHNNTVRLSNRVPIGEIIAIVRANDLDLAQNGEVVFNFYAGNEDYFFELEPCSGALRVNESLVMIDYEVFNMEVVAADIGKPQRSLRQDLKIIVNSSIPYMQESRGGLSQWLSDNDLHAMIAGCTLGIGIATVAIIAIVVRCMMAKRKMYGSYNCRTEALKALANIREEEQGKGTLNR